MPLLERTVKEFVAILNPAHWMISLPLPPSAPLLCQDSVLNSPLCLPNPSPAPPHAFRPLQVLSLACSDLSTTWPPIPALPSHWPHLPTSPPSSWVMINSVPQSWNGCSLSSLIPGHSERYVPGDKHIPTGMQQIALAGRDQASPSRPEVLKMSTVPRRLLALKGSERQVNLYALLLTQ